MIRIEGSGAELAFSRFEGEADVAATQMPRTNRRWASSDRTRAAIVEAARALYSENGYERTTVEDVVVRSGVSVGSIYHHIGGKADIYRAVVDTVSREWAAASRAAQAQARAKGETDAVRLYLHGARAYLKMCWVDSAVTAAMLGDDKPVDTEHPGSSYAVRLLASARDLHIGEEPSPMTSALVVIALLKVAGQQITEVTSEDDADRLADYYLGLIYRLVKDGPAEL